MKKKHVFQVIVEQDEAGFFVVECPALRACDTQGKTYEEAIENIHDVIALGLEDYKNVCEKPMVGPSRDRQGAVFVSQGGPLPHGRGSVGASHTRSKSEGKRIPRQPEIIGIKRVEVAV